MKWNQYLPKVLVRLLDLVGVEVDLAAHFVELLAHFGHALFGLLVGRIVERGG